MRKKTRKIKIKDIYIGGDAPITIQSMLKLPTTSVKEIITEINNLEVAGCDIIRAAVPDFESAEAVKEIIKSTNIPFVADIHFDYRLAIKSVENGVHKLRINPGNIGGKDKVKEVVKCLKEYDIPVRIGINAGSLEKDILEKHGSPTPEALVESAYRSISYFGEFDYDNIVMSIKSNDVDTTIKANTLFSKRYDYPIHLGITEAGAKLAGIVRSSVGIGHLLYEGIGDTIRVSLTGESIDEIKTGKEILTTLGIRKEGLRIVSCPTCARCKSDILGIVESIKKKTDKMEISKAITIAIMGCAVNGPGEAKEADMGVACGIDNAVFFKEGKKIQSLRKDEIIDFVINEIKILNKKST